MKTNWNKWTLATATVLGLASACLAAGGKQGGGFKPGGFKPNLGSSGAPRVQFAGNQGIQKLAGNQGIKTLPIKPTLPVKPVGPVKPPLGGPIGPISPIGPVKPPVGPIKPPLGPIGPIKPPIGPLGPVTPPICPPCNPPCNTGPKCCWWGGWCYNPCTPIIIPIGCGGYYGGGYTSVVTETVVVEVPAQSVVVNEVAPAPAEPAKEEKLLQVPVGATLTLQGKELSDKPGQVVLQFEKFSFPAQVNEWKPDHVTTTLPQMGLAAPTKAQIFLLKESGEVATTVAVELLPAAAR